MLNYLWAGMILLGIIIAAFTGRLNDVTNTAISSAKDAVMLCITMAGVVSMWTGLMKIGEKSGLIRAMSDKMAVVLKPLFPDVPKNSKAMEYISTNFIANIFGLGWAATPAGLKAMEEMQRFNRDKKTASRSMCMFMIVNMSSLQLVTVNLLAYRAQYNSQNPAEIIGPGIFATLVSTIAAIILAKLFERWDFR